MVTLEEALAQRRAFNRMVSTCTVPQVKIVMHAQWSEWRRVTETLKEMADVEGENPDNYVIALACEIVPGTFVWDHAGDCRLVRKLERDGQMSLHIEDRNGRPIYQNLVGPTSPVVVLDVPIRAGDPLPPDADEIAQSINDHTTITSASDVVS